MGEKQNATTSVAPERRVFLRAFQVRSYRARDFPKRALNIVRDLRDCPFNIRFCLYFYPQLLEEALKFFMQRELYLR